MHTPSAGCSRRGSPVAGLSGGETEFDWHWLMEKEYGYGGELDCYGMDMLEDVLEEF